MTLQLMRNGLFEIQGRINLIVLFSSFISLGKVDRSFNIEDESITHLIVSSSC